MGKVLPFNSTEPLEPPLIPRKGASFLKAYREVLRLNILRRNDVRDRYREEKKSLAEVVVEMMQEKGWSIEDFFNLGKNVCLEEEFPSSVSKAPEKRNLLLFPRKKT